MTRELWASLDRRQQVLVEVINDLGDRAHFGHIIRHEAGGYQWTTRDIEVELAELLAIGAIEAEEVNGVIYYAEA